MPRAACQKGAAFRVEQIEHVRCLLGEGNERVVICTLEQADLAVNSAESSGRQGGRAVNDAYQHWLRRRRASTSCTKSRQPKAVYPWIRRLVMREVDMKAPCVEAKCLNRRLAF